jgi:phage terminase large subunit-like protein
MIQYEKIDDKQRIDVFDADVFAAVRMLEDLEKSQNAGKWLDG